MRPVQTITAFVFAATVGMFTLLAAPAWAAPVAIHVSPSPVTAGHTVTVSGSVGPEAAGSDCSSIILYSDAFAPTNDLGNPIPVYTTAKPDGTFTATTTIPRSKRAGTYPIHLRCGGATLGRATLVIRAAPTTPPANVHVSPSPVTAGHTVTVSGSVGPDCSGPVTLISKAFVHTHDFAGLPAVFAAVQPGGAFTTTTEIPRSTAAGTYTITGRCGGGNLGVSATLMVRAPSSVSGRLPFTGSTTAPLLFAGLGLLGLGALAFVVGRRGRHAA